MTSNSPGGADAVLPATLNASTSPRVAGGHPAGGTGPFNSVARPGSGEPEVPTPGPPRPVRLVELRREPAGDLWCFGCRRRLPHHDVLEDHADPKRRNPWLGPWWRRECSGCGQDRTYFPGCGPL